jgi:hypothetical protein
VDFEIIGEISNIEKIAANKSIRDLVRLQKTYGKAHWRKLKGMARIRLPNGRIRSAELHWYGRTESVEKKSDGNVTLINSSEKGTEMTSNFVICIDNTGYPASLELHKIYKVLPDERAAEDEYLRIIDESGEDYLYSAKRFLAVDLPKKAQQSIARKLRESTVLAGATSGATSSTTRKIRHRQPNSARR